LLIFPLLTNSSGNFHRDKSAEKHIITFGFMHKSVKVDFSSGKLATGKNDAALSGLRLMVQQ
jgi:hypothetical protein